MAHPQYTPPHADMNIDATKTPHQAGVTVLEVVGVFQSKEALRDAMSELQQNGFMRHELGFLADEKTVREKLGTDYQSIHDLKHDPRTPRADFMPDDPIGEAEAAMVGIPLYVAAVTATTAVVASGGTVLAALLAAVGAGAGAGIIGGYFSAKLMKHQDEYFQKQIDKGGMLIWVNVANEAKERLASDILRKHGATEVQTHQIALEG